MTGKSQPHAMALNHRQAVLLFLNFSYRFRRTVASIETKPSTANDAFRKLTTSYEIFPVASLSLSKPSDPKSAITTTTTITADTRIELLNLFLNGDCPPLNRMRRGMAPLAARRSLHLAPTLRRGSTSRRSGVASPIHTARAVRRHSHAGAWERADQGRSTRRSVYFFAFLMKSASNVLSEFFSLPSARWKASAKSKPISCQSMTWATR